MSINGSSYSNQAVQAQERTPLYIYCNVPANPNPTIRLRRSGTTDILKETSTSEVLSYSINRLQCSDTGNYTCSGESKEFNTKQKVFQINVNCESHYSRNLLTYYKMLAIRITWIS